MTAWPSRVIADLVHVDPVTLAVVFRAKPADRVVLVTDAVAWQSAWAKDQGITMVDGAPRLPDGTIAGSALTMDQAVRNLVQVVGVDLVDAVRAASTNPARVMGHADRGVLAVGARADVVALDADLAGGPGLDRRPTPARLTPSGLDGGLAPTSSSPAIGVESCRGLPSGVEPSASAGRRGRVLPKVG